MRFQKMRVALLLAVCVMVISAGPAFAQSGLQGYTNGGEDVAGALQGGGDEAGTVSADSGGSLPFTGLDIALILGVGAGLVAIGARHTQVDAPRHGVVRKLTGRMTGAPIRRSCRVLG